MENIHPAGRTGGAGAAQPARKLPEPKNAGEIIKDRVKGLLEREYKRHGNRGKVIIDYDISPLDGKLSVKVDASNWKGSEVTWKGSSKKELADKIKTRLDGTRFRKPTSEEVTAGKAVIVL